MAERGIRLHRSVALVGMMGSGKSAIGRTLAARLGLPLLDSDAALEEAARRSIAEIFARDGERFFRAREAEVVGRVLAGPPGILSTGGGAWMSEDVRAAVSARGVSVWLRADLDTLWSRVKGRSHRPLLQGGDGRAVLRELMAAREPRYAAADHAVDSRPDRGVQQTAEAVLRALREDASR